ncbi:MAG: efflux RND transporter permease subunit [Planctomycetes bacterium]|nr:efflux RND transporter permease subunit [Planctomycetota bacterium]
MLRRIVRRSLEYRGTVIAVACLATAYGAYVAGRAKLDVFPEFAPPQVFIHTEAPGLSPEQVETLVTRPVESAVNGAGNLQAIRSQSIQGLSVVTAVFNEGTEVFRARQIVAERLGEISGRLPQGVRTPIMAPLTSSTSLVLAVGLTSEERSPMETRTFADWTVRPRLLGVPGVASVVEFGGEVRQLQIQVRPDRLEAYGLSLEDVIGAARKATGVLGAGFLETAAQRITVRTEGQALTPDELGRAIVAQPEGSSIRLKDVALNIAGPEPELGDAAIAWREGDKPQHHPGVVLLVWSQFGANTLEVTEAVERALDELKPAFESERITLHPGLFRPADFIRASVRNVNSALIIGGVLVAGVLFLFLLNVPTAFISFVAIPLSLLAAIVVIDRSGGSINTITLGGLTIAIGIVVDDAVIGVENTVRRLRQNRLLSEPRSAARVILEATLEVRSPVVYATFIVALVFLPVLLMSGVQGRLFAPLGISFILATLASLAVALTVTPALCFVLLRRGSLPPEHGYIGRLKALHAAVLRAICIRPLWVISAAVLICGGAAAAVPFFGGEFLPEFREGHFIVQMSAAPGTSLSESMRLGREVALELLRNPNVQTVSQQAGRAELGEDAVGTEFSEFIVRIKPERADEAEKVQSELRAALARFPGVQFAVKTFLVERIEETISGARAEVVIRVYGNDLNVIDRKAEEVAELLSGIHGASDIQVKSSLGEPQLVVRLRRDRLDHYGLRAVDVLEAVETAYEGTDIAQVYEGNRVFEVATVLEPAARRDPEAVGSLRVRSPEGLSVRVKDIADVDLVDGRHVVLHEGTRRYQAVTCDVRGRDLASFVEETQRRIGAEVPFPTGAYAVVGGAAEAQSQARKDILAHSVVAGVGVLVLLAIVFGTLRNLLLLLANLPFALVGGVLAVLVTGGAISVGSLVGFVTLFGITMRNSILMVSHFEHLVVVEGMPWSLETALRGASERLVPILMTALVTALGLLPLALGGEKPGREIEHPMAVVILGGLITSTALTLFVLPALALRFGGFNTRSGAMARSVAYRDPPSAGKSRSAGGGSLFKRVARSAEGQVILFLCALTALKCFIASHTELHMTEAYYWLYAQHPSLSYFDHPGMVGWMIWISTTLFGNGELGVRMMGILASGMTVWLAFLTGRHLYGERVGRLAAFLVGLVPLTVRATMAMPDTPLLLFWMAALWALAKALQGRDRRWWYAAGVLVGAAMLSKYYALFLPLGIVIFLLLSPTHRFWLRRREPWFATLLALLIFLPCLVWNAQHGLESFIYQTVGRFAEIRGAWERASLVIGAGYFWS